VSSADLLVTALVEEAEDAALRALAERLAPFLQTSDGEDGGDRWLTVQSAAAYLDCKPRRLYEFTRRDEIPFERDGRRLLFLRSELDAWVRNGGAKRIAPGPLTCETTGRRVVLQSKSGAGVREHPAPGDGPSHPGPAARGRLDAIGLSNQEG
jgi:excisionase family DNA binding protein